MLIRKKDGAFLYATTDLATLRYRMQEWDPDAVLYVVDFRQSMHFEHLFATARLMGCEKMELKHVSFGTVLGTDGKPFKTRAGDAVGLESLLDEAVARAAKVVEANDEAKPKGPELSSEERAKIAETVGIAALKYADLSQNRESDYVFSYDKMLAMNGKHGHLHAVRLCPECGASLPRATWISTPSEPAVRRSFWTHRPSGP